MPYANSKEVYYQTVARNLFLNQKFFKILDSFSEVNVPVIPLKGIALIQGVYPDSGDRYIGDIDLLVKTEDVSKATDILRKIEYSTPYYYFNPKIPYGIYFNSLPFGKPSKIPYFIHLHWHLLNTSLPLFMYKIHMEEIWEKAVPLKYEGREILMMESNHLIVYLCVHAFKHSFNKMSLFYDIQKVLEFYKKELVWDLVVKTAKDWNATVPLYYALELTCKILGINYLEDILKNIKPKEISDKGYNILSSVSQDKLGTNNLVYPLYLEMVGGGFNKIKFLFLSLFPPPEQLSRIYSVNSKYLVPLYYFKRLGYGISQFAKSLFQ